MTEPRRGMEELREIRTFLEQGRYAEALALVGEMEEMRKIVRPDHGNLPSGESPTPDVDGLR